MNNVILVIMFPFLSRGTHKSTLSYEEEDIKHTSYIIITHLFYLYDREQSQEIPLDDCL